MCSAERDNSDGDVLAWSVYSYIMQQAQLLLFEKSRKRLHLKSNTCVTDEQSVNRYKAIATSR